MDHLAAARPDFAPEQQSESKIDVAILGIGTATPPHADQTLMTDRIAEMCCTTDGQKAWLARVFLRSGVQRRGSVLIDSDNQLSKSKEFYPPPSTSNQHGPSTAVRMRRYAAEAPPLGAAAATSALAAARTSPATVTHLISVSCTGFSAPGLDIQLIRRLGLRPDVRRLHLGFMGCHAACNALAAARDAVLADPEALVLVCCVELCTLHFAYGWNPETLIVNGLFGDGAAAAVVGRPFSDSGGHCRVWRLRTTASRLLPESLEAMTWNIGDHGFSMTLSPEVPDLISRHLRPWCESWLAGCELSIAGIKNWAIHPGGPKVLTAAAMALGLDESALCCSRDVLAAHGNMSSATILFLLQRIAELNASGPCVALGFGPGLMAEAMLLDR
ncbi:MAG TPA: type III polyketide synthase [Phycisphaerae bacterium]|nr:type III polyketide synthase [Phycisphaerae bacterium]